MCLVSLGNNALFSLHIQGLDKTKDVKHSITRRHEIRVTPDVGETNLGSWRYQGSWCLRHGVLERSKRHEYLSGKSFKRTWLEYRVQTRYTKPGLISWAVLRSPRKLALLSLPISTSTPALQMCRCGLPQTLIGGDDTLARLSSTAHTLGTLASLSAPYPRFPPHFHTSATRIFLVLSASNKIPDQSVVPLKAAHCLARSSLWLNDHTQFHVSRPHVRPD